MLNDDIDWPVMSDIIIPTEPYTIHLLTLRYCLTLLL